MSLRAGSDPSVPAVDPALAQSTRTAEITLRTACPRCGAPVGVHGPHLTVPCGCGNRIGVPTAVLAGALDAFEDERGAGEIERGGALWSWTVCASLPEGPDAGRVTEAPVLLVAQVPHALQIVGGDDGETVHEGPGPRWWVVLAGVGRAEERRRKQQARKQRQADIDALRLREYEASLVENERHKADIARRRAEERQEHERSSRMILALAWGFVGLSILGMAGSTSLLAIGDELNLPDAVLIGTRVVLLISGGLMGLMALTVSSAAAAYRVHEPLLAYVGFACLVAVGAALPGIGVGVAAVYAIRLSRGLDPTLRGVRRTTPGGGRPMAVALVAFCATVQLGVVAISGATLQEVGRNLSEGLGF